MDEIREQLNQAVKSVFSEDLDIEITRPEEKFGDYATNVALQLAKKTDKNPRDVAKKIVEALEDSKNIAKTEVAGPGFINIWLSDEAIWQTAESEPKKSLSGKTIVAEYSDPNPFKILHAGHLYTTIAGDAIASLLEAAGAKVHRLNYGGDVGLHVAKTMWAILEKLGGEKPEVLGSVPKNECMSWLSERYVEGNSAYDDDEKSKKAIIEINKKIYKLHSDNDHDSAFAQIYWACREWSYEGFDELYKKLAIDSFEKYVAESEVTQLGIELVEKGLKEGTFEKSDGAVVFRGEDHGLHTRVFINSEGLPTYEAKDLGLAASKWQQYKFDTSVVITGNDIVEYMKVVLKALAHFYPEVAKRSRHLTHGMIKLPGSVKMSSRRGNFLRADDILEAAAEANKKVSEKHDDKVVLGAVKYAFLKQRMGGDIIYDPDESVSIHGNSGPYLQYAYARANSIIKKSQKTNSDATDLQTDERSLLKKLGEYSEVVEQATNELMPHHICTYLYELAQTFNRFYENNRVVGDPREGLRLKLVRLYADRLKSGLELLNIPVPDSM